MNTLSVIPERGIAYVQDGVELGSIIIRPEVIAFIAGKWCQQISRNANQSAIETLAREHNQRMASLIRRQR